MQSKVTTNISSLLTTQTINMTEEDQDDQDLQNRELHHGKMKFEETWNVNQRRKGSCWTRHVTSGKHIWRDLRRAYLRHTQLELLTIEHSNSGLFWMWACPENKCLYIENNTYSRGVISPGLIDMGPTEPQYWTYHINIVPKIIFTKCLCTVIWAYTPRIYPGSKIYGER